jgi:hypothetical protein
VHNTLVVVLEDSYGFSHKVEGWDGVIDVLDESCYLIGVSQGSLPITLLDVSSWILNAWDDVIRYGPWLS